MLSLSGTHRVFLCQKAVDFRKAHDGLCAIVRDEFRDDPFAGDIFAFFNRAKDRIKLLVWDRNGFWLCYKRLEEGTFPFAVSGEGRIEIDRGRLAMILEGIEWKNAKRSSHYTMKFDIRRHNGAKARTPP